MNVYGNFSKFNQNFLCKPCVTAMDPVTIWYSAKPLTGWWTTWLYRSLEVTLYCYLSEWMGSTRHAGWCGPCLVTAGWNQHKTLVTLGIGAKRSAVIGISQFTVTDV